VQYEFQRVTHGTTNLWPTYNVKSSSAVLICASAEAFQITVLIAFAIGLEWTTQILVRWIRYCSFCIRCCNQVQRVCMGTATYAVAAQWKFCYTAWLHLQSRAIIHSHPHMQTHHRHFSFHSSAAFAL